MKLKLIPTMPDEPLPKRDEDRPETEIDLGRRMYLDLNPSAKQRRRHGINDCLVIEQGGIFLDYDQGGFLVGLEIVEGDPFKMKIHPIDYMQPKNPLANGATNAVPAGDSVGGDNKDVTFG